MPTNITFTDFISNTTVSSLSMAAANVGTPDPDRQVLIGVTANGAGINSVTVNGNAASQQVLITGATVTAGLYTLPLASGATASIVATLSGIANYASVSVFDLQDGSLAASSIDSSSLSAASSINSNNVVIPVNGAALFLVSSSTAASIAWTNAAVENFNLTASGSCSAAVSTFTSPTLLGLADGVSLLLLANGADRLLIDTITATPSVGTPDLAIAGAAWSFFTSAHAFLPFRNVSNVRFR